MAVVALVLAVIGVVAMSIGGALAVNHAAATPATTPSAPNALSTPRARATRTPIPTPMPAPVAPAPLNVLVIGDSIMKGYGVGASNAWPALLSAQEGWTLNSQACNGAGFVTVGAKDCVENFPQIIAGTAGLTPSIILISGSSNDFGQSDSALQSATTLSFARLRGQFPSARIIALSTVWGDTTSPAQLATINSQVSAAAQAVGGSYIDIGQPLNGRPDLMQDDDIHPTVAGQQLLERAIFGALQQATVNGAEQYLTTAVTAPRQ